MSFVNCYLPYFRQWLITHPLLALLSSSLCLLKVCVETSSLSLPASLVGLQHPAALLHVPFQFLVYSSVFVCVYVCGGDSVCPGGYAGLYQSGLWEYCVMFGAHLFVCWMSPKQVWSWHLVVGPSCFVSVMWCGEALCGLGVQGVKVLILFCALFLPSVSPASQQDF
jgi:hypothetical protein